MSLLDFLTTKKPSSRNERTVRVKVLSDIRARPAGKLDLEHLSAGTTVDLPESEAVALASDGSVQKVGEVARDGSVMIAPTPPTPKPKRAPAVPAPMPEMFKELPAPFARAWELLAKRRALVADYQAAIEDKLPPGFLKVRGKEEEKFFTRIVVGEGAIVQLDKLNTAAEDAENALREFDAREGYALASAILAAGKATLEKIHAANTASEKLASIAFETFSARIAPLELHETKRRSLFTGSGLATKYASFTPFGQHGAVFLGGHNPDVALDLPVETMASTYRTAAARLAEVEALMPEARAELAAAQGVTTKLKRAA